MLNKKRIINIREDYSNVSYCFNVKDEVTAIDMLMKHLGYTDCLWNTPHSIKLMGEKNKCLGFTIYNNEVLYLIEDK